MTIAEVQVVVENYNISYQNQWNQIRWLGYINASCAGNKLNQPKDLIVFAWEQEEVEETKEDIEETRNRLLSVLETV